MLYILIISFVIVGFSIFSLGFTLNIVSITYAIKNTVKVRYDKWKQLNNMVSIKYPIQNGLSNLGFLKRTLMIKWISITMIIQTFYTLLIQYIDNTVIKIDKNKYEISYVINGKLYKMIVKPNRCPPPIIDITNEDGTNVSNIIIPYLEHNNNLNCTAFYPDFFGYKQLNITLSNGDIKVFCHSETIIL